jgi:hypothetical protein
MVVKIKKLLTKLNCGNIHIQPFSLWSRSNEKKPSYREQLQHIDESKRVQPSVCTSNHVTELGSDDSSLTSTDVSSCGNSSPTPCTTIGQLSMKDEGVEYFNTVCSPWFPDFNKLSVADDHEEQKHQPQRESDPFFRKLPHAKKYSNQQRKLSAHEGYVADFGYGSVLSKNSENDVATSVDSVQRHEDDDKTARDCTLGNADNIDQVNPRGVARSDPFEQYEDDYSITSTRSRCSRNTNKGRTTPRGIARPEPLVSHRSGEQEFILPTMIVASSMFGSPLSAPATVFNRATIVNNSVSRSSTASKSLSTSPLSCNQSKRLNRSICLDFDDDSSAGESRNSLLHYSCLGSDNIDRLMRCSTSDDEWSQASVQSMPTNIAAASILEYSSPSRIYILLLAPDTKQFELLEISDLRLSVTTIGHILDRIPTASTVPALGSRYYTGLCRPKDGIEMTGQQVPAGKVSGGWRITRGEILIAIPQGFSGQECMKMCSQILLNPKLVKLLQRKNPLAPKKKNRSSSSSSSSSIGSSSSNISRPNRNHRCQLQKILEKHDI